MFLIIILTLLCGVILILIRYSLWRQRVCKSIPANEISFYNFLGDLAEILIFEKTDGSYDIHKHLMAVSRQWLERHRGKQVFCIWILYKPVVIFVGANAVKELLKDLKMYDKSSFYDSLKLVFGSGLLTSPAEKWKSRRKLLNPCFHHDMLKQYLEVFNANSRIVVKLLKQETEKEFSDVKKPLTRVAMDTICETMLGFSIGTLENDNLEYIKAAGRLTDMFMEIQFKFWLWPYITLRLSSYYREGYGYIQLFLDLARSAFNERKKEYLSKSKIDSKGKRKALIDVIMKLYFESEDLNEEETVKEIVTFILAGFETVAMSMTWALYLIGLHPEVQEKIHEELDKVFGDDIDRDATEEDLNQLNYLHFVLMESNRIYPTVPIFGREALKDTVICGYTIPKGASCIVPSYFLHRDENVFPDPEKFDPERFSPQNSTKIPEGAYVPFSAGPRNCIGQRFAWMEMKTIMSAILRNYSFESLDSRDKVFPVMKMDLVPSTDIRIRIRPRKITKS